MKNFKELIELGFEIKVATTVVVNSAVEQHTFVQNQGDVFVCRLRQNISGGFDFVASHQIA